MKRVLTWIVLLGSVSLGLVSLAGCSESELHNSMEEMGGAYKAMKESQTAAAMKAELSTFKSQLAIAQQQAVNPEDQNAFDEGLQKVEEQVGRLELALETNNLDLANAILAELRELNKEYHDKLGVE